MRPRKKASPILRKASEGINIVIKDFLNKCIYCDPWFYCGSSWILINVSFALGEKLFPGINDIIEFGMHYDNHMIGRIIIVRKLDKNIRSPKYHSKKCVYFLEDTAGENADWDNKKAYNES